MTSASRRPRPSWIRAGSRALHRLAVHAYPAPFRRDFGSELHAIFDQRQAAATSALHALGLAVFQVADAVRHRSVGARAPGRDSMGLAGPNGAVRIRQESCHERGMVEGGYAPRAATISPGAPVCRRDGGDARAGYWRQQRDLRRRLLGVMAAAAVRAIPTRSSSSGATTHARASRTILSLRRISRRFARHRRWRQTEAMYSFLIPVQMRIGSEPEVIQASAVTPGMLGLLGRPPMLGRTFQAGDTSPGIVLSYDFWERRFGRDPDIVGQTIDIVGAPKRPTVLGVMPEDFVFPYRSMLGPSGFTRVQHADIWLPLHATFDARLVDPSGQPNRNLHYLGVVGRLKNGLSIDRASRRPGGDCDRIEQRRFRTRTTAGKSRCGPCTNRRSDNSVPRS